MSLKIITASILAVAGLTSATVFASTNPTIQANFTNLQTAITNKDLAGYKTAKTELINSRKTNELTRINATTQEELNSLGDKQAKWLAVQTAITNNDYNAFRTSADAKMLARTPDQANFDKLVAGQKAHIASELKESEAIKNNDFNAYKLAESEEVNNRTLNNTNNKKSNRPAQTEAEMKTRFDQMVSDYKATGTLPSDSKGFFDGHGMGDYGDKGFVGGRERGSRDNN